LSRSTGELWNETGCCMKLCIKRLVQVLDGGTNVFGSRYVRVARVAIHGEVPAASN
jgi:hypothetical protein